jgi:hypothetical protein
MMPRYAPALVAILSSSAAAQQGSSPTHICLAPASVAASVGSATSASDAVRQALTSFLTGPSIGVLPLSARLEPQARQEAKAANCRYLLFTEIKHQRKQGKSILSRAAGGAVQHGAWRVVGEAGSGVGRVAADAAAGAAGAAVSEMAYSTRAKDEMSLKYRLEAADGKILVDKSGKRKAESDGEDLLTPLAQQAAEAVAAAVQDAP